MYTKSVNKLVSIILPTYNGRRYIKQTIESCLNQTYTNLELIIVDDGSTDGTGEIIQKYAESHNNVRSIINSRNCNLPSALNIGFNAAKGDYFTWISDDNLFALDAIEVLVRSLEESKADLVYSSYEVIDEDSNYIDVYKFELFDIIFKCVVGACFLYKKEIHTRLNGYDIAKFRMEDYDFWLRALPEFKFHQIDNPKLYKYRKHTKNLTSSIFQNQNLFNNYKKNYVDTFDLFFNDKLKANFTQKQLCAHADIFFDSVMLNRNLTTRDIGNMQDYLDHFEVLKNLNWALVGLDQDKMTLIINKKERYFVMALISTLMFENTVLKEKNPRLNKSLSKSIFWYYKEYETLPKWYKRVGHVIKFLQGNK